MPAVGFYIGADSSGRWIGRPMPAATDPQIAQFEQCFGARLRDGRLPEAFRRFLLTINGGVIRDVSGDQRFCIQSNSMKGRQVHIAHGVGTLDVATLIEHRGGDAQQTGSLWYQQNRWLGPGIFPDMHLYYRNMPGDVFPVGGASSEFCDNESLMLGVHGHRYGRVYVFRMDTELWNDEMLDVPGARLDAEDFLFPVADDFDGFLAGLHPCGS